MSQDANNPACQQCQFEKFSRGGNDWLDMVALLLSFLVLWVKPEVTLFPTGLALYMIPCIFDAVKSKQRCTADSVSNWLHIVALLLLGVIAFFGVMGEMKCIIESGVSIIVFSESFHAIIPIPRIRTLWFLLIAGLPLVFTAMKYVRPKEVRVKRGVVTQEA